MLWSLLGAFDLAFEEDDRSRILRLCEASLTASIRMRVAPNVIQIILDTLGYSEVIRVMAIGAGADC